MRRCCVHCGNTVGETQRLCTTCKLGVTKYPEQNAVILAAYVGAGMVELDTFMEHHAAFAAYLDGRKR